MRSEPAFPFDAVLFDLDGTLADTVELILLSYRHTMERHLGSSPPDAEWIAGMGRPLRDQLAGFASSPEEARAMLDTYVTFQRSVHDTMVRPYPGVVELVARLAARSYPVAVVTSKRRGAARATLRCCGLDGHLPLIVGGDDVEHGKPDPAAVHRALELLRRGPSRRVLFVGDSPHDVHAGNAAGVSTAAVLWGPFDPVVLSQARPHHVLEDIASLARLLFGGVDSVPRP